MQITTAGPRDILHLFPFLKIKAQLIYNVVPISTLQQSDPVINMYRFSFLWIIFRMIYQDTTFIFPFSFHFFIYKRVNCSLILQSSLLQDGLVFFNLVPVPIDCPWTSPVPAFFPGLPHFFPSAFFSFRSLVRWDKK